MNFDNYFNKNKEILYKLFGKDYIEKRYNYLKRRFEFTETKWKENLKRFENQPIKYLLIAEAPPYNEGLRPEYNYAYYNFNKGSVCPAIWRAFFPHDKNFPNDPEKALRNLAEQKFLLIDSLPFSLPYGSKRNKKPYGQLVVNCKDFILEKIKRTNLKWDKDISIALAYKKNGEEICKTFGDEKLINNAGVKIKSIIFSGRGPNSKKIRNFWKLNNL